MKRRLALLLLPLLLIFLSAALTSATHYESQSPVVPALELQRMLRFQATWEAACAPLTPIINAAGQIECRDWYPPAPDH